MTLAVALHNTEYAIMKGGYRDRIRPISRGCFTSDCVDILYVDGQNVVENLPKRFGPDEKDYKPGYNDLQLDE